MFWLLDIVCHESYAEDTLDIERSCTMGQASDVIRKTLKTMVISPTLGTTCEQSRRNSFPISLSLLCEDLFRLSFISWSSRRVPTGVHPS